MTCPDMEAKVAEFLAGELSERSGVEEHLLACADCRSKFSIAKSGWEAAAAWKVAGPSGDAIASTLAALEPAEPPRALLRVLQAGTLAASLVIAVAIGTSRRGEVESRPAPVSATPSAPASTGLASLRPSVGLLFVQDENGKPAGELAIGRLNVRVDIREGIARTEIEEVFENRTDQRLEGTFQFPLPPDASISRLAMEIDGKLMEGEVVEREKARQTYEGIVRSMKDPALLEWMPGGIFQCRIFPIEARSDKRIVIAYTQALSVFDGRGRYVYPLSGESARELGIGRFEFTATIRAGSKIVSAASTSHAAPTIRLDDRTMRTTFAHSDFRPRADFVLAFETEGRAEILSSAHRPEGSEPGYFAAFITPRTDPEEDVRRDRKLHFLVDASGSVARPELEASRAVVRRMIESLGPPDRFKIGCHNLFTGTMPDYVAPDEAGKRAADRYLSEIAPAGACDVATALETVLADVPDNGEVVYVGEGTPTWGEKDPAKIVARIREAIGTRRISIRTVAVGSDADKGLLETVSREFNGGAHAISPSDDVHERAGEIARTLGRSALTDVKVEFRGAVTDAAPAKPGPIHFGERLLVTGRYGAGPVTLVLTGRVHDRTIVREFALALPERDGGNLHVKRLWAQRRLADLVAQGGEKRAEAVKLSVEHQVMTPYTSFLVLENEKAYEQHKIDRTKKAADQQHDPNKKLAANEARQKEIQALLAQAKSQFEREQYGQCIDVCDRILNIDPRLSSVDEMKMIAQRLGHVKADRDLTRTYIDEWKRVWAQTAALDLNGPVRPQSSEVLRNRRPKGILGAESDGVEAAESHYRMALRYYDSGDFEKAEAECAKAVSLNPSHGASHALMLEVQFALGKGRVKLQSLEHDSIIQMATARQQQVIFEVRDAMDNGTRAYNLGKYEDAERHFRTVIEYAKWLPSGTGIDAQRKQASEMLEKNRMARGAPSQSMPVQREAVDSLKPERRSEGTLGKLVNDDLYDINPAFSTLPGSQFGTFLESDVESTANGGLAFSVGEGTRRFRSRNSWTEGGGSALAGASFTLVEPLGYDIGGTGFTDIEEDSVQSDVDSLTTNLKLVTQQLDARLAQMKAEEARTTVTGTTIFNLNEMEVTFQHLARKRQQLQETIANLNAARIRSDVVAPRKALSGKVTAVATELDFVLISIGRDAGVNEGDEFTITRATSFICKIVIDRVDRQWASGRVVLKGKAEPLVGDDAASGWGPPPTPTIKVTWTSGNEVHLSGADRWGFWAGSEVLLSRNDKFVAVVRIYEVNGTTAKARVAPGMRGIPIEVGDPGIWIRSQAELWSVLPLHIRQDIVSERDLAAARRKLRALREVAP